ncbi:MAG: response regulator, partial [Erysipelotrichaceae bacterium]|nr:response regulator [Erysipelotrichaceae bacterium]
RLFCVNPAVNLENYLEKKEIDIQAFLSDLSIQDDFLDSVFYEVFSDMQIKNTTGSFLIFANDKPIEERNDYVGIFIRDSDPTHKTANNTDLLFEKGSKSLARKENISLDSAWSTRFHFEGVGNREADDFFYKPYLTAIENISVKMINLAYWSKPFVLEDYYLDSHKMITYSLPLIYDNVIYGVVGTEVSLSYLEDYLDVRGLDKDFNAGFVLTNVNKNGEYEAIAGKGVLYEYASAYDNAMTFSDKGIKDLYKVDGVKLGDQDICAMKQKLNVYSNNVPYDNTDWELIALVSEDSIFATGSKLYNSITTVIIVSVLLELAVVMLMVENVLNPIYRLVDSVKNGLEGIKAFKPSKIQEIDDLHEVVEVVTEAQKKTEESLIEEKERYRLAIESSEDIFFTYHKQEKKLEIVNTGIADGTYDISTDTHIFEMLSVHEDDLRGVYDLAVHSSSKFEKELRIKREGTNEYEWYLLCGDTINDENDTLSMVVGYLHNIHSQKMREIEESMNMLLDPVTSFYNYDAGLNILSEINTGGVVFCIEINNFQKFNEKYGLTFNDVLLEQLANVLRRNFGEDTLFIRASSEKIIGYTLDTNNFLENIRNSRNDFRKLSNYENMDFNFKCGYTFNKAIKEAHIALKQAKLKEIDDLAFNELSEEEKKVAVNTKMGVVDSIGYSNKMSLVSLALNLFDRNAPLGTLLDLLSAKIEDRYHIKDLLITSFNKEDLTNAVEYTYKNNRNGLIYQQSNEEISDLLLTESDNLLYSISKYYSYSKMFENFAIAKDGIGADMSDNGYYSGSIFFEGIDEEYLNDENIRKELREIATIIQNKINQERHDLSAQAKADFLARMSHEIRTPMNGIIGMTEIALKENQSSEKRVDCLEKIKSSSQHLLSLVNDILDMSKIESGKMQIDEERSNLKKKLSSLNNLVSSKINEKKLNYNEKIELVHSWFMTDELRISQVLINLLGNAIKYTNEGGNVYFEAIETPIDENTSKIHFAVKDDGVGISKKDQHLVFKSFEQAKDQEGVYRQGTGLGLAISDRLVHMMGSRIELESELGQGSTFSFDLIIKVAEESVEEENIVVNTDEFKGKRILIAEDNMLNQEIIKTILEDYGIEVDIADNGEIAVEKMAKSSEGYYDMIFMDVMMPKKNGLEATREIRKLDHPNAKTIPIVAMTANAFMEEQKQSVASGMNAHLTKPLDIEKLQITLKEYLG